MTNKFTRTKQKKVQAIAMQSMSSGHSDGLVLLLLLEMGHSLTFMLVMAASVETQAITQSSLQMLPLTPRNKTFNQNHKEKIQKTSHLQKRRKKEKAKRKKRNEYK